jgi:gp16 family phage-associated protein
MTEQERLGIAALELQNALLAAFTRFVEQITPNEHCATAMPIATATPSLKTAAQVCDEFKRKGLSPSAWADAHGFSRTLVYEILNEKPHRRCTAGISHRIAVMLGLKAGKLGAKPSDMNVVQEPQPA